MQLHRADECVPGGSDPVQPSRHVDRRVTQCRDPARLALRLTSGRATEPARIDNLAVRHDAAGARVDHAVAERGGIVEHADDTDPRLDIDPAGGHNRQR